MDRNVILIILLVAVIVNVLIIALALFNLRRRRAEDRPDQSRPIQPAGVLATTGPPTSETLATATRASPGEPVSTGSIPATSTATVAPMTQRIPSNDQAAPSSTGRWALPPHEDESAETTIDALVHERGVAVTHEDPELDALVDPVTGFGARQAWDEAFSNEERRLARYHRASTVFVAELDGFDALAERLGRVPADRLIPPLADALRRHARNADILTRVGHTRFHALLPETDEIAAINYIERVRAASEMWLEAGAVAVRLVIGWASPPAGGTLADALRVAEERMNADRRPGSRARASAEPAGGQPLDAAPPPATPPPASEPYPGAGGLTPREGLVINPEKPSL